MSEQEHDEYRVVVRHDTPSNGELPGEMERTGTPGEGKAAEDSPEAPAQPSDPPAAQSAPTEAPVVSPPTQAVAPEVNSASSSGTLILQWLTYAFWFWFGISISWLANVVINYFISGGNYGIWENELAYPLAAVIVMMIIAVVTDVVYSRREPAHKKGAANVIMLLHAVPFILVGIGSLITIVFSVITMALSSSPYGSENGPLQVLLVALVVAVIYGVLANRVIQGGRKPVVRRIMWVLFGVVALGFIGAALAGPAVETARTKQDRLIESALPPLSSEIRDYTAKNGKLPASLADVGGSGNGDVEAVQKVIEQNLVVYKPNTLQPGTSTQPASPEKMYSIPKPPLGVEGQKRFYYQLCTTYKVEKKSRYTNGYGIDGYVIDSPESTSVDDYLYDQLYVGDHPAGEVCYGLYADSAQPVVD